MFKRILLLTLFMTTASFAQLQVKNQGGTTVMTVDNSGNVTANGKTTTTSIRITGGSPASGQVLTATDAQGNASWQPLSITESDGVVGNEVVGVADNSLSRQGSGTASSPYTLQINKSTTDGWYVNEGQSNSITSGMITDREVKTNDIQNDAVTAAKLSHTGVTAGRYVNANVTVDAQGRVSAIENGYGDSPEDAYEHANMTSSSISLTSEWQDLATLSYGPGVWVIMAQAMGLIEKSNTTGDAAIEFRIAGVVSGVVSPGSIGRCASAFGTVTKMDGSGMIWYGPVYDTWGTTVKLQARINSYGNTGTVTAIMYGDGNLYFGGDTTHLMAMKLRDI